MVMDSLKQAGVKMALNRYLEDFGEIRQIDINPEAEHISMEATLKGDVQLLHLELDYHLKAEALELRKFQCDRAWIENALNRYAAGRTIPLRNGAVEGMLTMLL